MVRPTPTATFAVVLLAALALAGCADHGLQTRRPPRLAPAAVIWDCAHRAVVRPRSLVVACADGNTALVGMRWRAWGAETATARGRAVVNPCDPNCAVGHHVSYPVRILASNLLIGDTHAAYASVTLVATGRRPAHVTRRLRFPLPTSEPGGRS